jgi:crotonobetainyl-CoA:carnitine CoA-transferase CaiB-like acyl-CoA transferase
MSSGPLAGVRVIDFSRFQQGPYATRLLADLGADVVKIERPGGDWDRELRATPDGFSGFFYGLNCGKKSVAVDIQTAAGREVILRLAREADVIVENFRPGVMDRLRLGYADLSAVNGSVIYAAAGGWGPAGPNRAEPMYDMVGQAVPGDPRLRRRRGRRLPRNGNHRRPVRQDAHRARPACRCLPRRRLHRAAHAGDHGRPEPGRDLPAAGTGDSRFGSVPLPRWRMAGHRGHGPEALGAALPRP